MNCEAEAEGMVYVAEADAAVRDESEEAADAMAEGAALTTLDAAEALDEAADNALETADAAAPDALGMSMGTPTPAQVDWTVEMTAAWSEAEHAPWMQGCTVERRLAPF